MASDRADVSHADRRFALIVLKNNVKPLGHDVNFLLEPVATDARFITLKTRLHAQELKNSVDAQPPMLTGRSSTSPMYFHNNDPEMLTCK